MKKIREFYGWVLTRLYFLRLSWRNRHKSAEDIFSDYWRSNHWRNSESKSGDGSTLKYTENIRRELPNLVERYDIKILLDVPCGDFNWFREVPLPFGVRYIGGDIVDDLIAQLSEKYGSSVREFKVVDAISDVLPTADMWMCRDLIFHLPNKDIRQLFDNFLASPVKYLLITSHAGAEVANVDTFMGGFRLVDLLKPPFSLPPAGLRVADYIEGYPERYLMLYHRDVIEEWRSVR